ncbi:Uncharacterised protein [Bordetella pertussis]|nr:Uncharacterised protein [Bordetella pertussis]CFL87231.1 Uncharacterised protein [Bordetella pertussis]CFM05582.1 Uncharacterised protein [Bordetella pertussis]CFM47651.1 Uncharacterised protein [Bordetella pertussis]CFN58813.1 Uncharacterised protein [Bordetella pertussis]
MVPWLAASTPSAPYSALTMHIEVSTLPATTDAGGFGRSIDPSGMMISSGLRQPAFSGISSSTRVRNTYSTAATAIAPGALKLFSSWPEVPVKSTTALRAWRSTRTATSMTAPLSSR